MWDCLCPSIHSEHGSRYQIGFDSKAASFIANQTVKGAASLLIDGKNHPEFEIDKSRHQRMYNFWPERNGAQWI